MLNNNYFAYTSYLRKRSLLGYLYRKFWLYPGLSKFINGKCIDIGCGIGDFLSFNKGAVGYDINPLNVEYCLKRGLDAQIMYINLLPIQDQDINTVILDNVIEHIENPIPLLNEIYRVLKDDGVLLIGVPGVLGFQADSDHKIMYTENLLYELASKSSFKIEKFIYFPFIKSDFLSNKINQYCIYTIWRRMKNENN
jgi:SAM-dependent methyltransferase